MKHFLAWIVQINCHVPICEETNLLVSCSAFYNSTQGSVCLLACNLHEQEAIGQFEKAMMKMQAMECVNRFLLTRFRCKRHYKIRKKYQTYSLQRDKNQLELKTNIIGKISKCSRTYYPDKEMIFHLFTGEKLNGINYIFLFQILKSPLCITQLTQYHASREIRKVMNLDMVENLAHIKPSAR